MDWMNLRFSRVATALRVSLLRFAPSNPVLIPVGTKPKCESLIGCPTMLEIRTAVRQVGIFTLGFA